MADDSNVSSLLSTLLNGGYQAPSSDMQALAGSEPMTGATVLARLKGAGNNGVLGKLNTGGSAVPNDLNGSKLGGLVSGFANGMKDAADARAAQQKQSIELMKLQWDHQFKTAELKQKIDSGNATAAETKRYHDILDKYYTGQNEKTSKSDDPESPDNQKKIQEARYKAAQNAGLYDKALLNHAQGAPAMAGDYEYSQPGVKEAAQAELARRMKEFKDWDSKRSWNQNGKSAGPIPKGDPNADDATGNPPADPNADPDTSNVPTPPARPTDLAPPAAPDLSPPAASPAAPAGPRSVTGPDGKKYTYTDEGGLVPATPDTAQPGFAGDDAVPGI